MFKILGTTKKNTWDYKTRNLYDSGSQTWENMSPGGLVKIYIAEPHPSESYSLDLGYSVNVCMSTRFPLMLLLPVQGPYFENHWFKEIASNLYFLLNWISIHWVCFTYITSSHLFIQTGPCEQVKLSENTFAASYRLMTFWELISFSALARHEE